MEFERLETIAMDIKQSVFENETEAMMYITKDIYRDCFIVSVPVITLSFDVSMDNPDRDYDWFLKMNGIGPLVRKEKLIDTIKLTIEEFGI